LSLLDNGEVQGEVFTFDFKINFFIIAFKYNSDALCYNSQLRLQFNVFILMIDNSAGLNQMIVLLTLLL